jgi:hypothetical protein
MYDIEELRIWSFLWGQFLTDLDQRIGLYSECSQELALEWTTGVRCEQSEYNELN